MNLFPEFYKNSRISVGKIFTSETNLETTQQTLILNLTYLNLMLLKYYLLREAMANC